MMLFSSAPLPLSKVVNRALRSLGGEVGHEVRMTDVLEPPAACCTFKSP